MKIKTLIAMLFSVFMLVSCGSDSDDDDNDEPNTATLTGTAAVGTALVDKAVTAIDRLGIEVFTTTDANGGFSIVVNGDANPYMLKVEGNSSGELFYSYADGSGIANITPMTSLALHEAFKEGSSYSDLADRFSNFATDYGELTSAELEVAKSKVNANLASLFSSEGVDNGFDFFKTAFSANGSGIDAILDALEISIGSGTDAGIISITIEGLTAFDFNANIDINDFTIGGDNGGNTGGGLAGTWDLTISGTSSGVSIPAVTINNIPAEAVPTEGAAGQAEEAFNSSFGAIGSVSNYSFDITSSSDTEVVLTVAGTVTIPASDQIPFAITNSYNLVYTYTKQ